MTAINVYRTRDVAYLFGDGANYDLDGRLVAITGKAHVLSSLNCAMLISGRSIVGPYVAHLLEHSAQNFDHLMRIMPAKLEGMVDSLTDLFGADRSDSAKGEKQGFRIFVAGWSDERREMVAFSIGTVDTTGHPAFEISENTSGFQSPGVSDVENARGFGGPFTVTPESIESVAETILELQRHQLWEDGKHYVGGLVELVTVKRDGITTKILKRWNEDQVGELIQPKPIDWAAWRARRTPPRPAGAAPVIQMSRAERRKAEAIARRAT